MPVRRIGQFLFPLPPLPELHMRTPARKLKHDVDGRDHELVVEVIDALKLMLAAPLLCVPFVENAMGEKRGNGGRPEIVDVAVAGKGQGDALEISVIEEFDDAAMEALGIAAGQGGEVVSLQEPVVGEVLEYLNVPEHRLKTAMPPGLSASCTFFFCNTLGMRCHGDVSIMEQKRMRSSALVVVVVGVWFVGIDCCGVDRDRLGGK